MTALLQDSFSVFILHKAKFIQNRKLTNFSVGILDNLTYFRIQYCFSILYQCTTERESLVFLQDSFESYFGIKKFVLLIAMLEIFILGKLCKFIFSNEVLKIRLFVFHYNLKELFLFLAYHEHIFCSLILGALRRP